MAQVADDQLARQATQGDRRAFEAIYQRYHRDLYRFCLAMVGNPQDAQDALQNTMVKVLRALPGEKRHIQLKPWLYRIARNEAVETVRKRRDSVELEPEHAVSIAGVAETAEARERLRGLIADLEELPDRQRAALVMRELSDLGFEQIGEAFETSAAVARQTVYEARLSLRQMEEGREMSCDRVMRELSDADGRVTRRREVRAHLRACPSCRAFRDSIETRRGELAAIAPLPLAVSAGLLHGILGGKASAAGLSGSAAGATGGSGGGLAGAVGAGAGKAVATATILKAAATVAVVAVGVTAADRGGLIHVPLMGGGAKSSQAPSSPPASNGSTTGAGGESAGAGGQDGTSSGGAHRAGSPQATSARGAKRVNSRSAGSRGGAHRASSANAHSKGRNASHARRHGHTAEMPASSSHGRGPAAAHKATARHAKQSPSHASHRHTSRRSHRKSPPRHVSHHTAPPPKPAPPKAEGAAPAPTPPPPTSESAGASSAGRPAGGVE